MQLTGQEIVSNKIITNYCEKGIQQQGIDVRVDKLFTLNIQESYMAGVYKDKTIIPRRDEIEPVNGRWLLEPGYYEVQLMEGTNLDNFHCLYFKSRSSMVRCGAIVYSGQFDAGFKTDSMGCFLHVIEPLYLERGARIAQAIVNETHIVSNTYNGQFQNDKQRK